MPTPRCIFLEDDGGCLNLQTHPDHTYDPKTLGVIPLEPMCDKHDGCGYFPMLDGCPFCGKSKLVKICETPSAQKNGRGWFVSHGGKACVLAGYSSRGFATPEEAIAAWNRRAPVDQEGGQP